MCLAMRVNAFITAGNTMIGAIWVNESRRIPDGHVSHLNGTEDNGRSSLGE